MATRQARMKFTIKRTKNFIVSFSRSKRGIIGITILILATILALGAPFIAPHQPVTDRDLAGYTAKPSWYDTIFPSQPQSQDIVALDTNFNDSTTLSNLNITSSTSSVTSYYDANFGYTAPGSLAIAYNSNPASQKTSQFANITKTFYYPYIHYLDFFIATAKFYVTGTSHIDPITDQLVLDIPVHVSVLLIDPMGTILTTNSTTNQTTSRLGTVRYDLSALAAAIKGPSGEIVPTVTSPPNGWFPDRPVSSFDSRGIRGNLNGVLFDPAVNVFDTSTRHSYTYAIEVSFLANTPHSNPNAQSVVYVDDVSLKGFGTAYGPFGTDDLGRDIYSQLIWGSRVSLLVGLGSAVIGIGLGLVIGIIAGYQGGIVDELLMRFTDALLVIPTLPLLLVLVAVLGQNLWNIVLVLGLLGWMGFARVVRSMILSLRERPFVESAKAVGAGNMHIMGVHILPNIMAMVYVNLAMTVPSNIVAEASLSFLGFSDPNLMSWGKMLQFVSQSQVYVSYWWWVVPPGLLISIVALSFIFIGYALDEILNPKLRERR
jgi:peptide/nickel transport system permease protein